MLVLEALTGRTYELQCTASTRCVAHAAQTRTHLTPRLRLAGRRAAPPAAPRRAPASRTHVRASLRRRLAAARVTAGTPRCALCCRGDSRTLRCVCVALTRARLRARAATAPLHLHARSVDAVTAVLATLTGLPPADQARSARAAHKITRAQRKRHPC
jgi:hypothetical protein